MPNKKKSRRGAHFTKLNSERAAGMQPAPNTDDGSDGGSDYEEEDDASSDASGNVLDQCDEAFDDPAATKRRRQYAESKARCRKRQARAGAKQRRHARILRQYMTEYRKGASGDSVLRAVAVQRSKRHRDTSDARARQVEARMEVAAFV